MVEYDVLPEDFLLRLFPRNLSYSEESYLDNFSICAAYVKVPKQNKRVGYSEQTLKNQDFDFLDQECPDIDTDLVEIRKSHGMEAEGTSVDPEYPGMSKENTSEVGSEEGIFVNMMDDLELVGSQTTMESPLSNASAESDPSYFSLDSVGSPDENGQMNSVDQECLSKAVTRELQRSELRKSVPDNSIETQSDDSRSVEVSERSANVVKSNSAKLKLDTKLANTGAEASHKYLLVLPDSPLYDEPEFNINKAELRKSSSLKSTKTPPGTPSRKKIVRFADAMGLDLESVRHVLDAENPPRIPSSAIKDLKVGVELDRRVVGSRLLALCFTQPSADPNFMTKVMANKVCLENCVITDMAITGVVRVANIGYHKCVRVRYSINNWVTFYDVMASYVQNSCSGSTDRFSFTIVAPSSLGPGTNISFAVSYTVNDVVYWDSNDSKNYEISCFAKSTPTNLEESWVHFV
ncbi:glycogen-binding subunit 76A-like [Mya arenaria]|uniref:glycogen-binding subunit 76A-like n=1 Tax=Mya arenaria TaxID=6604 RepID=UPI0022E90D14|nr:glycogen-binding subunit 76A-like [Mya arenaria]